MNPTEEKKQLTITLSRENIINAILGLQLVLLGVFGWQLMSIKSELADGGSGAKVVAKAPTQQANPEPAQAAGPVDVVVTSDDHVRGGENAKVTIVEYSDFECPFCEAAYPTIKQVMDTYGDDVRIVYRHFPLSFHAQAQKSAEASECAADQGKFWEYHDMVFENQALISGGVTQFKKWAADLRLNTTRFNSCLDSGEKADEVTDDMNSGVALGVSGTPGFFINGISVVGAQPFSSFKQIIDQELANS